MHHEQTAGPMADVHFKVRHEPVATFTSCGPRSANLVMALAVAMMDSSAFFAITGNVPTSQFNRQPFQGTGRYYHGDFPSVIRPYVKRSYQPTRVDMVPLTVRQRWELMLSGRPGPMNLDMPLNVFVAETEVEPQRTVTRTFNGAPGNPQALTTALEMLLTASAPWSSPARAYRWPKRRRNCRSLRSAPASPSSPARTPPMIGMVPIRNIMVLTCLPVRRILIVSSKAP
jgi:acetolactate synthase-1/2/3 large subunit